MNNLKYRVYSVSSQNQQYRARNLQDQTGIWQSQHNCTYPQELTVQFFVPINTKNMKLTFHQYKIPKLIEVFVRCSKQDKYRKLGLIQPNDNMQSSYLQNQIKTVFFQFPCSYIKLIIHQNYRNQMNLFDQVAICQLSFQGQVMPSSQYKNLDINILDSLDTSSDQQTTNSLQKQPSQQLYFQQHNIQKKSSALMTSSLFPEIFQKFQELKKQAVQKQQYQKAAYIKNSMNNFLEVQKQILKMQQLKKIALEQQDYDRCHKYKIQINKKKQMISYQIKQFQDQLMMDQNVLTFSRANTIQNHPQSKASANSQRESQKQQQSQKTPVMNRNISPNPFNQYQSQVVPAVKNKKNVEQSYMSIAKANESVLDGLRSPTTQKKEDQQNVQQSVDYNNYDMSKVLAEFPELQQLEFRKFKKYQPFFDFIRLQVWRMILSEKYWKVKTIALDWILNLQVTEGKHLIAVMQAVAITIIDSHTVNIKKSLQILQKLIHLPNKDIWCDANYPRFFIDTILQTLIQLMNDTKQQFRQLAVQIYKNLPQFSLVYLQTSIKHIVKKAKLSKNKRKSTPRLSLAKLSVIEYYLSTFMDVMHHLNQIIRWLAQCANDSSSEVRATATQMLLDIARMDKDLFNKIKEELNRQSADLWVSFEPQYNSLMQQIQSSKVMEKKNANLSNINNQNQQEIDIYKRQTIKSKNQNSSRMSSQNPSQRININQSSIASNNINKQSQQIQLAYSQQSMSPNNSRSHQWFANSIDKQREGQIKVMQPYDDELEGLCDYCYKKYEEADYNQHLRNNCCVVIPCVYCGCAIYLREMTVHYLTGCQKKKHQQCPRCLLAFQFDEINEHVARKICRKNKPHMQRCPFCQEDIEADDVAWVDHAERCNKIVRGSTSAKQISDY